MPSEEDRQILEMLAAGVSPSDVDPGRLNRDRSLRLPNRGVGRADGPYLTEDDRRALTANVAWLSQFAATRSGIPGFVAAGPRAFLHFNPSAVRVGVVTSGGICPGVNTVVDAIVRRHYSYAPGAASRTSLGPAVLGFTNGFRGIIDGTFLALDPSITESWPRRGGSVLRQLREESGTYPDPNRIVDALRRFAVDIIYVVGGDGSLRTAAAMTSIVQGLGLNMAVIHIPKTMDNDIPWVTESFGFQTAIAEAARLVNAIRDEAESNNRIAIVEVFGAGVGHTASHIALGSGEVDAVLIPELGSIDMLSLLDHLDRRALGAGRKGFAVIVAAERVQPSLNLANPTGSPLVSALEARFRMPDITSRVFVNQPRHFIRAVPANCHDQLYCRQLAASAVDCALAGYTGVSISKWLDNYVMVPFVRTAGRRKDLPLDGMVWERVVEMTGQPDLGPLRP